MSSKRAPGPIGNWLRNGSNGSLGWPSTATMSVFAPSIADVRQPRGRGVAEPQPDPRAGPRLELRAARPRRWRRRGRPSARAPREGRIGEIVPDPPLLVDAPVRQHDRDVLVDVDLLGLLDDDRTEEAASLLAGVGRAGMGQIEIEAGDRAGRSGCRRSPPARAAARSGRRSRRCALAARRPGKLSAVGSASLLTNLSFSSSPFLSRRSGPGVAPA